MSDADYTPEKLRAQERAGGADGHTGAYKAYAEGGDKSLIGRHALVDEALADAYARLTVGLCRDLGTPPGPELIDLGCAIGTITDAFRRAGFKACGVDLSVKAVETARRERPSCEFHAESADDDAALPGRLFDWAHAREFYPLTRVSDPAVHGKLLGALARRLRPGGVLVVTQLVEPGKGLEATLPGLKARLKDIGWARHESSALAPLKLAVKLGGLLDTRVGRLAAVAAGAVLKPVSASARHRLHLFVKP